jgi:parallel beta-helix repeat protein
MRHFSLQYMLLIVIILHSVQLSATTYYVSATGNDLNTGKNPAQAWKTLNKVNNLVPKPGDSILFRRGDSWSGSISVNMFGREDAPIVYGAFGSGPKPKIYGSEIIKGWTKHSGNIYKAAFDKEINQLFVDDEKMRVARFPNRGYVTISSVIDNKKFSSDDLPLGIDYAGAVWFGRTGYYHTTVHKVVTSMSGKLTLDDVPQKDLNEGEGFILMNKLTFLDEAGEWCYDASAGIVYLWLPKGDSPDNYNIRGSIHKYGFYARSKNNIVIRDFEISQQAFAGIDFEDSKNWKIIGNDFVFPDAYGINNESSGDNHFISKNKIAGANHLGIQLRIDFSEVSDNEILQTGLFNNLGITGNGRFYFGSAVFIRGKKNILKYNRIIDVNYNGIFFAGPENTVAYNYIKNICMVKGDGGGIYTTQPGSNPTTGSVVSHNIVINSVGNKDGFTSKVSFGEGIYIDESAHGVTVEYNTVYKTSNAGIKLHKTDGNIVRFNTIMDARYSLQVLESSGSTPAIISNNIMYSTSNGCVDNYEPRQLFVRTSSPNAILENNVYRNSYESKGIFRDQDYCSFKDWQEKKGYDSGSQYYGNKLLPGETERLFYNDTKHTKTIDLGDKSYKDVFGKAITGSFTLEPFTSKILIGIDSSF